MRMALDPSLLLNPLAAFAETSRMIDELTKKRERQQDKDKGAPNRGLPPPPGMPESISSTLMRIQQAGLRANWDQENNDNLKKIEGHLGEMKGDVKDLRPMPAMGR